MQPVSFTAASADQVAVYRFFEMPFGNGEKNLRKRGRSLGRIDIQHPEWIKVERLNLRTALFEKPANNTEVTQPLALTKCLFQVLVEKNV